MGKHKHGKDSAKAKALKAYKDENRLAINKAKKAAKTAAGKKCSTHKMKKTWLMKWDELIRKTPEGKPYVDSTTGAVCWGVDAKATKEQVRAMMNEGKKKRKRKKKSNGGETDSATVATA